MNREIKFRYWSEDTKSMVFGKEALRILNEVVNHDLIVNNFMQFTGRKDRDGKEIYEGDIVTYIDFSTGVNGDGNEFTNMGVIEYDEYLMCWFVSNRQEVSMDDIYDSEEEMLVVGNIFENIDLLAGF